MNIRSLLPAMVLAPASLLFAQAEITEAAKPKLSEANKQYQSLVAEYDAVQADYRKRMQKVQRSDEYKELRRDGDRDGIRALTRQVERPDVAGFVTRFQAGAEQHAGTPAAADFLYWVVSNGRRQRVAVEEAVETLVDQHLASKKMWLLAVNTRSFQGHLGVERTLEVLDAIIDGNPHRVSNSARCCCNSSTRPKAAFQRDSSSPATRRLSGSTVSNCRCARPAS